MFELSISLVRLSFNFLWLLTLLGINALRRSVSGQSYVLVGIRTGSTEAVLHDRKASTLIVADVDAVEINVDPATANVVHPDTDASQFVFEAGPHTWEWLHPQFTWVFRENTDRDGESDTGRAERWESSHGYSPPSHHL